MLIYFANAFRKEWSYYIQWNCLLLWGLGLWLTLCTNNMYRSDNLADGAMPLYKEDWSSVIEIGYNIPSKEEPMEHVLCDRPLDYNISTSTVNGRTLTKHSKAFIFVCFIIVSIYTYEHVKERIERLKNLLFDSYKVNCYFGRCGDHVTRCTICECDTDSFRTDLLTNCQENNEHSWKDIQCGVEESIEYVVKKTESCHKNIIQDKIVLGNYTTLLFNTYKIYDYINYKQIKSVPKNILVRNLKDNTLKTCKSNLKLSRNRKDDNSLVLKNSIQKGIISSSPEFQEFLADLQRIRYFCPYVLKISTNYVIRIKSGCK